MKRGLPRKTVQVLLQWCLNALVVVQSPLRGCRRLCHECVSVCFAGESCVCVSAMVHCHHEPAGDLAHWTHGSAAPRLPAQDPHQDYQGTVRLAARLVFHKFGRSRIWSGPKGSRRRPGSRPSALLQKKYRDFRLQGVLDSTLNSKMYDTVRNRLTVEEATASVREGGMQGISMKDSDEEDEDDD